MLGAGLYRCSVTAKHSLLRVLSFKIGYIFAHAKVILYPPVRYEARTANITAAQYYCSGHITRQSANTVTQLYAALSHSAELTVKRELLFGFKCLYHRLYLVCALGSKDEMVLIQAGYLT